MSCTFSWQKYTKSMRNSHSNLRFVRVLTRRQWRCMSLSMGTRLEVILWVHVMPLYIQRLGNKTPHQSDVGLWCGNRWRSNAHLQSWTMYAPGQVLCNHRPSPVNQGHNSVVVFMRLRSCRLCCDWNCMLGCFMTHIFLELVKPWLIDPHVFASCMHQFSLEADMNLESLAEPMSVQRSNKSPKITKETNGENAIWNKENIWEMRTSRGIIIIYTWCNLLGVTKWLFGL